MMAQTQAPVFNIEINMPEDLERLIMPTQGENTGRRATNTELVFDTDTYKEGDYVKCKNYVYRINKIKVDKNGRIAYAQSLTFVRSPPPIDEDITLATDTDIEKAIKNQGDLCLGTTEYGGKARLDSDLIHLHTFLTGKTGSGKTTTAKRLLIELAKVDDVTPIIIDTHDEYSEVLEKENIRYRYLNDGMSMTEYMTLDHLKEQHKLMMEAEVRDENVLLEYRNMIKQLLEYRPHWLIYNVAGMGLEEKQTTVSNLINQLFTLRKQGVVGKFVFFIDEAHNYAPQGRKAESKDMIMTLASEGRKFGFGLVVITQRPARLEKSVISQCNVAFIHKLTNPRDVNQASANTPGMSRGIKEQLPYLETGECFMTTPKLQTPIRISVKEV